MRGLPDNFVYCDKCNRAHHKTTSHVCYTVGQRGYRTQQTPSNPTSLPNPCSYPASHPQAPSKGKETPAQAIPKGPNQTEREALELLNHLTPVSLTFEGRSFPLAGGHTFTPDWCSPTMCVEVKGEHIHSRDSRIFFDIARTQYPDIVWVWVRKRSKGRKGKRWDIEIYNHSGSRRMIAP